MTMGFITAVKSCLSKYAVFRGRASRSEFWWFILFGVLMHVLVLLFDSLVLGTVTGEFITQLNPDNPSGPPQFVGWRWHDDSYNLLILELLLLLPVLAVSARRLHDVGRSGSWTFLPFASMIGLPVLTTLVALLAVPWLNILVLVVTVLLTLISILALLFWWVQPSEAGENVYGLPPHPRQPATQSVFTRSRPGSQEANATLQRREPFLSSRDDRRIP